MFQRRSFLCLCFLYVFHLVLYADLIHGENPNRLVGNTFWFGALPSAHTTDATNITLIITTFSEYPARVFIVTNTISRAMDFQENGISNTITLPGSFIPTRDGVSDNGVVIAEMHGDIILVQLSVNSDIPNSSEGTILWPIDLTGGQYIINGMYPYEIFSIVPSAVYTLSTQVVIAFTNGTKRSEILGQYQSWSFSGSNLTGAIIRGNNQLSVFGGYTGAGDLMEPHETTVKDSYLWEQLAPITMFDTDFIFVNPSGSGSNSTLYFLNSEECPVQINVSGLAPLLLNSFGAATITTKNLTHSIHSNGSIDVQAVSGSLLGGNRTQFGLIPNTQFGSASVVKNTIFAFSAPGNSSRIVLVAQTSDIHNQTSQLEFGQGKPKLSPFPLKSFQLSADPSYSFAFYTPFLGQNNMFSNFDLAAYLFSSSINGTNFGSCLIRS